MEYSKVNVTAGIFARSGILTIELLIGLGLCAFLCSVITTYQWYSFFWQLQTTQRLHVMHLLEDLIQQMRLKPDHYQSLFPYQQHDVMITITQEINAATDHHYHLIYVHAQWKVLPHKSQTNITIPITLMVPQ